jgi:hypothetical protein
MSLLSPTPHTTGEQKGIHDPPPSNRISYKVPRQGNIAANHNSESGYKRAIVILTLLGFITRFYNISHPSEVVFDEVYFGRVRLPLVYLLASVETESITDSSPFILYSSHPTTYSARIALISIPRSPSSCSPSPGGWLVMMANSSLTTSGIRTSITMFPTLLSAPGLRPWVLSPSLLYF